MDRIYRGKINEEPMKCLPFKPSFFFFLDTIENLTKKLETEDLLNICVVIN